LADGAEAVDEQPVEDAELVEGVGAGHHPELLAGLHVLEAMAQRCSPLTRSHHLGMQRPRMAILLAGTP